MTLLTRRFALTLGLAIIGVGLFASGAEAQMRRRVVSGRAFPSVQSVYPSFVPTQLQQSALRQWEYNARVAARVYSRFPPYYFGYNPYPQVVNYGPVYRYPVYPTYPVYTPPYYPTYPTTFYANPYLETPNPYLNPPSYGVYP
ncbi:MAG: hypothetical protein L0Z62_08605 [Gemmataceae bacterium]|nr:hypothetical protein [Gemmataceae bacterium]